MSGVDTKALRALLAAAAQGRRHYCGSGTRNGPYVLAGDDATYRTATYAGERSHADAALDAAAVNALPALLGELEELERLYCDAASRRILETDELRGMARHAMREGLAACDALRARCAKLRELLSRATGTLAVYLPEDDAEGWALLAEANAALGDDARGGGK